MEDEMMEDIEDSDPEMSEDNVYKKSSRDKLVENDEISASEEGFMTGYEAEEEDDDDEI